MFWLTAAPGPRRQMTRLPASEYGVKGLAGNALPHQGRVGSVRRTFCCGLQCRMGASPLVGWKGCVGTDSIFVEDCTRSQFPAFSKLGFGQLTLARELCGEDLGWFLPGPLRQLVTCQFPCFDLNHLSFWLSRNLSAQYSQLVSIACISTSNTSLSVSRFRPSRSNRSPVLSRGLPTRCNPPCGTDLPGECGVQRLKRQIESAQSSTLVGTVRQRQRTRISGRAKIALCNGRGRSPPTQWSSLGFWA